MRTIVLAVRLPGSAERDRPPDPGEAPARWRCRNPHCLHKDRWWMSAQGVVNCRNCRPPAFPGLAVDEGDALDPPSVESGRSNQANIRRLPGLDALDEKAAKSRATTHPHRQTPAEARRS
ncbi:MAG TPA: hypothetical protein VG406_28760 [Isosphaeraceae bacterium]|jgi:hypothetical protein|nr:hypothetical protein [Isosphaeraceae bacterium]